MIGVPLSQEWRQAHVNYGDRAMAELHKLMADMDDDNEESTEDLMASAALMSLLAQTAQAHYQAANIRTKPSPFPEARPLHEAP